MCSKHTPNVISACRVHFCLGDINLPNKLKLQISSKAIKNNNNNLKKWQDETFLKRQGIWQQTNCKNERKNKFLLTSVWEAGGGNYII